MKQCISKEIETGERSLIPLAESASPFLEPNLIFWLPKPDREQRGLKKKKIFWGEDIIAPKRRKHRLSDGRNYCEELKENNAVIISNFVLSLC